MKKFNDEKKWIERSRSGTEFYRSIIFHPLKIGNLGRKLITDN
ncbi:MULTISPECIES: hypothetical protein [Okeania]|nr:MULTISPECIES: hypothetical protein [Okeania]